MVRLFIASDFLHFMPAEKEKIRMKEARESPQSLQSGNFFKSFPDCDSKINRDWQHDLVNSCRKCKRFLIYFYHENYVDCDTNNNNNNIGIVNIMYQFPETTK